MKTSAEYLALCQRYRILKLKRQDPNERDYLQAFEDSYYILSKTAQVLTRFRAVLTGVRKPEVTFQHPDIFHYRYSPPKGVDSLRERPAPRRGAMTRRKTDIAGD